MTPPRRPAAQRPASRPRPRPQARSPRWRPLLERLEDRCLLSGTSPAFVTQVYRDLLKRDPEPAALAGWAALLDHGLPRGGMALAVEASPEYRARLAEAWYGSLLGRPADPAGLAGTVALLGAGASPDQVRATLIGSPEYSQRRAGGTVAGFTDALYHDVLNRPPDPAGARSVGLLLTAFEFWPDPGQARTFVAGLVLQSDEARRDEVQDVYLHYLHRPAEPGALGGWAGNLAQGMSEAQVTAAVVGSAEYAARLAVSPPAVVIQTPAPGLVTGRNVTVSGRVIDGGAGVASLQARVDSGPAVAVPFDAAGNFHFDTTLALDGTADGSHTVRLQAADRAGNVGGAAVAFTLRALAGPAAPRFDLSAASRSGAAGDHATAYGRVTLVGQTDPNVAVALVGTGLQTVATGTGSFAFPGVSLAPGANSLTARATGPDGRTADYGLTITRVAQAGPENAVLVWNGALLDAVRRDASPPPVASRAMAMVQAAVLDAVNAVEGTPAYYVALAAPAGTSADAAVAAAAHRVLSYLYPAQQAAFDALLATSLGQVPDGQPKADGVALGRAAGDAIIALRAHDGFDRFVDYTPGSGPGVWQPTPPAYAEALLPQWATLQPFAMTSPDQFRPSGPPALTSQQWADAVNEVKGLGSVASTTRTADQTQVARFWADGSGTVTPPGHWNAIAQDVAAQQGDSLSEDARLFAALDVALADAAVVAWDAKYAFNAWRPVTAIRAADTAANPAVQADPNWAPLLATPNFPEYVSGHSTFSATAATILDAFFGTAVPLTVTSEALPGVTRSYAGFDQAAAEAGQSRIYAGIHFQFSNQDGQAAGRALGAYVLKTFDVTGDTIPPQVHLDDVLPGGATRQNITVTGQVTDNLSGVASLTVQVDQGSAASVPLDATWRFAVPTALALDGSADGRHVLHFVARDVAGNTAAPVDFSFVLGTRAPAIALTGPADGASLAAGAGLAGTVGAGAAAVTALSYAFDGGTAVPVAFDPDSGAFNVALDLSHLAAGPHTLTVAARDAAGNPASTTIHVSLPALVPLTVTSITPTDGSADVGVTFRPKVVFSRPVDPATLTAADFFATAGTGAAVPAAVVPADDGTAAWLFFANPLPGATTVTLTVDGSGIKGADGTPLDAAGTGTPGSKLTTAFVTVSEANLPGTSLTGVIADPGPDLKPGTFDDVRAGPDGVLGTADDVYLHPLAGVKVWVLGQEGQAVTTDAQGRFHFASVPAGDVKLGIDGRTATNAPDGIYFPEMVMDLTIRAGVANTVMGGMGSREAQAANAGNLGVYLPRVQQSVLQTVSAMQPTTVGLTGASGLDLTPEQQQELKLTVQPGTLVGADGKKLTSGQVGISVVPPDLVKDMLPAGVLQHTFDITIQAPGVAEFTTPATLTFPNVFGAAPGTQLPFLSFDHTTGRLVIEGTATVSADGRTATTDPGSGITHPGWHGLTPPGVCGGPSGPPPVPKPPTAKDTTETKPPGPMPMATGAPLITGEDGSFNLTFSAPAGPPPGPPPAACQSPPAPPLGQGFKIITIAIDGPLGQFVKKTGTEPLDQPKRSFILFPGDAPRTLAGAAMAYKEMFGDGGFNQLQRDRVYGARIDVTEETINADGSKHTVKQAYYLYRWVDVVDAAKAVSHTGDTAAFLRTLWDPSRQTVRNKNVDLFLPSSSDTTFQGGDPEFSYPGSFRGSDFALWDFTPASAGDKSDTVTIRAGGTAVGHVTATARATPPATIVLNLDEFEKVLVDVVDALNPSTLPNVAGPSFLQFYNDVERLAHLNPKPVDQIRKKFDEVAAEMRDEVMQDFGRVNAGSMGAGFNVVDNPPDVDPQLADGGLVTLTWKPRVVVPDFGDVDGRAIPADPNDPKNRDVRTLAAWLRSPDIGDAAKEWGLAQSLDKDPVNSVEVAVIPHIVATATSFAKFLANTVGHEVAHTFSITEGYYFPNNGQKSKNLDPYDIMQAGDKNQGDLTFGARNRELLQAARGAQPNGDTALEEALHFYEDHFYTPHDPFSVQAAASDSNLRVLLSPSEEAPELVVTAAGEELSPGATAGFDPVAADGPRGASKTTNFVISNPGFLPLTINSVALADGSQGFSIINPGIVGTSLAPGASATLTVAFDPLTIGKHADKLTITSNAGGTPSLQIGLQGTAFAQAPTARLTLNKNNNLGGVTLHGGQPAAVADLATVTNDGAQPLTISAVQLAEGSASFTLTGLPADLAMKPIVLAHGQSFTFGVRFTPDKVGLERPLIRVSTNDPTNPVLRFSAVGTGLADTVYPHWGNDFVAIETPQLAGSFALRARSDDKGDFSFFLPPNQPYHLVIFDPQTGLVAHGYGTTPESGRGIDLSANLVFGPSTAPDEAGNGLPDDVKFAVGTSLTKVDTTGDGIDDFTKIAEGLDPLGGRGVPTGVIAGLALNGEAQKIVVQGSTQDPQAQTAYVATGSYGLAVVDVSRFDQPRLLSQLPLPGDNLDVSLDPARDRVAVAAGPAGLHLVDVSDPLRPVAGPTVALAHGAQAVSVFDGVAYVASGPDLVAIDLATQQVLQTLSLGGGDLTGLAREGALLVTTDRLNTLRAVDVSGTRMVARGSLGLPAAGGRLFVGNGIAYLGAGNAGREGFVTADVSDADHPKLLSGVGLDSVGGQMVAANGSGLAVAVGTPRLGSGSDSTDTPVLDVMDVSNAANTGAFLTQFNLPSSPLGVALASGMAFVADGTGGLQVVNYVPFDTRGVPPTVTISAPTADVDPNTPGIQVVQGSTVSVKADVRDDVQVRNVELLVNGQVVRNDVSFPFDLAFIAPNITALSSTVTVQVRATDTGGNSSLSNPLVMELRHGLPPAIRSINPADGAGASAGLRLIQVLLSKPLAAATVTPNTFRLLDGAGNRVASLDLRLRADDQLVQLAFDPLAVGSYQLVIDAAAVTDREGSPLGAGPVRSHFTLFATVTGKEVITTVAGTGVPGYSGDGGPATRAQLFLPAGVAVGADGTLYIADFEGQRVRRVGPDGVITTVAGNGTPGYGGDGGPATQAQLNTPYGVSVGPDGSLYIADAGNERIRRVRPDGIITTVAGSGSSANAGDGRPAQQAGLDIPSGIAVGPDGSLYIADQGHHRIRRVGPDGIITTVAGSGTLGGYGGDGGPATQAQLDHPTGVAVGADGSLYIADLDNSRIRRVGPDGIITTVAGNGTYSFIGDGRRYTSPGDGGPATQAQLAPTAVALGADGSLYIVDFYVIRRVGPDGIITTVAGNGTDGYGGDGGPATQAQLNLPEGVAVGPDGSLYIADTSNALIRLVDLAPRILSTSVPDGSALTSIRMIRVVFSKPLDPATVTADTFQLTGPGGVVAPVKVELVGNTTAQLTYPALDVGDYRLVIHAARVRDRTGTALAAADLTSHFRILPGVTGNEPITTVAGNGTRGNGGDGGPATQAQLQIPGAIAVGGDGSLYIADAGNGRIRRVGPDGVITTVARAGFADFYEAVAVGSDGSLYTTAGDPSGFSQGQDRVVRVGPDGVVTTVAGNHTPGGSGDGGPATQAQLNNVAGLAVGPDGSLYIADQGNNRVRRVGPDGVITTLAGNGTPGFSGDGGPATRASLYGVIGLAVAPDGSLYIADSVNNRVRRVAPDGTITTVAGNGTQGYGGDGGPATQAQLDRPQDLAVGVDGSLYIADDLNNRIRRVGPDGVITTVAGNGTKGYSGDGRPATQAQIETPTGVAVAPDGSVYFTDAYFSVRRIGLPPRILSNVTDGSVEGTSFHVAWITFPKALDRATVTADTFQLTGPGGVVQPDKIELLGNATAQLTYPDLGVGGYQLVIHADRVRDRAGGALGTSDLTTHFRVLPIATGTGTITTVAGNGDGHYGGDGGPATQAKLSSYAVAVGPDGSLYIADDYNNRIRRVGPDGVITTVAGNGTPGFGGDGGPATQAQLWGAFGVAVGPDGSLYIADSINNRVRRVGPDGIITTVAGGGNGGNYGPAQQAQLHGPTAVAVGPDGSLYIADGGNRVSRVGRDGNFTPVAYDSGGGWRGLAVGPDGSVYIADEGNNRVHRVGPDGVITTVAGNGAVGSYGDGGPATQAQLNQPIGVAVGADGTLYIADTENHRIRLVGPDGVITTVAGNVLRAYSGDGGPAQQAQLDEPFGVAVGADGSLYIADTANARVRRVAPG